MKKLLFFLVALCGIMAGCSSDNASDYTGDPDKGAIRLNSTSVGMSVQTRDYDLSTLTVILLTGPENRTIPYPTGGLISNLIPGAYNIEVTSHPDGMPLPAFENPYYQGTGAATVETGATKTVDITCTMKNAGLFFVTDATMDEYTDLAITVKQETNELVYSGANKSKWGYFAPANVVVTLKNGTEALNIGGAASQTLLLKEGKVIKVTLSTNPETTGSITLSVEVVEIDQPNQSDSWVVSGDEREPDFEMNRLIKAEVYWEPGKDRDVDFTLRTATVDGMYDMTIFGFAPAPAEGTTEYDFVLPSGTYNASDRLTRGEPYGSAMTFAPGYDSGSNFEGTVIAKWSPDMLVDEMHFAASGSIKVETKGDVTYLTADFLGDLLVWVQIGVGGRYETTPNVRRVYSIELPAKGWYNHYRAPGTLEFNDIPLGSYTASGTNVFYDQDGLEGPDSWTGTITAQSGIERGWALSCWSDFEGNFLLDYEKKRLWLSPGYSDIIDGTFALLFGSIYMDSYTGAPAVYLNPEINYNKDTKTIDFACEHYFGGQLAICGIFDYQAKKDYYMATDAYVNATLEITPTRSGNSAVPSIDAGAPGEVLRAGLLTSPHSVARTITPLKLDQSRSCYSSFTGYQKR